MAAKSNEQIIIYIGSEAIELTGDEKTAFIVERDARAAEAAAQQAAIEAKAAARQSALAKLAELGLTEEEIAAL